MTPAEQGYNMIKILLVGAGGFAGSIMRYCAGKAVTRIAGEHLFPYGTLFVNVTGCLVIGFLSGLIENRQMLSPNQRIFIMVGFLGGFTTFSTFGYEVFGFARNGETINALANMGLHGVLGLGAVWAGYTLSKILR